MGDDVVRSRNMHANDVSTSCRHEHARSPAQSYEAIEYCRKVNAPTLKIHPNWTSVLALEIIEALQLLRMQAFPFKLINQRGDCMFGLGVKIQ